MMRAEIYPVHARSVSGKFFEERFGEGMVIRFGKIAPSDPLIGW